MKSRAILQVFEAIHRGNADSKLLAYQYLQTLPKIANGSSSKMWIVPTEFTAALDGIAGALGGGKDGGPSGGSDDSDDDTRPGVDLSGSELDLGIASDLASISLQAPEEALARPGARSSRPPRRPVRSPLPRQAFPGRLPRMRPTAGPR